MGMRRHQGGWSFLGLLAVLTVAGIFIAVAFKLAPIYGEHQTIKSIMETTLLDQRLLSEPKRSIRSSIYKKMGINYLQPPADFLKITKDKGDVIMDINYEVRIPIFMNVDALVSFKEQYIGRELD